MFTNFALDTPEPPPTHSYNPSALDVFLNTSIYTRDKSLKMVTSMILYRGIHEDDFPEEKK
jgi:hypothetical protein